MELAQVMSWIGLVAVDPAGKRIGTLAGVYADRETHQPVWLLIRTSRIGLRQVLVPAGGAWVSDRQLHVSHPRDAIRTARQLAPDEPVIPRLERELCEYYGIEPTRGAQDADWERRSSLRLETNAELSPEGGPDWGPGGTVPRRRREEFRRVA